MTSELGFKHYPVGPPYILHVDDFVKVRQRAVRDPLDSRYRSVREPLEGRLVRRCGGAWRVRQVCGGARAKVCDGA